MLFLVCRVRCCPIKSYEAYNRNILKVDSLKPDWAPGVGLSTFSNFTIMKKLTIADKQKVCRFIINNTPVNGIVEEKHSKWLIKEIFVNHNEWEIKKGVGIDHLEVRISTTFRKNKEFWIVRTDGTETDISFTKCLTNNKDPQKTKIDDIRAQYLRNMF